MDVETGLDVQDSLREVLRVELEIFAEGTLRDLLADATAQLRLCVREEVRQLLVLFEEIHDRGPVQSEGQGQAQGQGRAQGQGPGQGQGQGIGLGQGQGVGQGQGHNQGQVQGQGSGHGQGVGQGQHIDEGSDLPMSLRGRTRPAPLAWTPPLTDENYETAGHQWTMRHMRGFTTSVKAGGGNRADLKRSMTFGLEGSIAAVDPNSPHRLHPGGTRQGRPGRQGHVNFSSANDEVQVLQTPSMELLSKDDSCEIQSLNTTANTPTRRMPAKMMVPPVSAPCPPCGQAPALPVSGAWTLGRQETMGQTCTQSMVPASASLRQDCYSEVSQGPNRRCTRLAGFVRSAVFDYLVGVLTVINAAVVGVQTDFMARHPLQAAPVGTRVLEVGFCIIFTVEIALRIAIQRRRYFYGSAWRWNVFDCIVTGAQILEEVLGAAGAVAPRLRISFTFVRVLVLLKVVQVIRLMRVVRFIGELRMLATSIMHSMKALGWTLLLLALMIYIAAVWFTQLAAHRAGQASVQPYYGSLGRTGLMLFMSVTGGIDWKEAVDPLVNDISPWLAPIFVLYIAFVTLAVLNVITGVFVEAALRNAKEEKDDFMINNVRELFMGGAQEGLHSALTWEDFERKLDWPQMLEYFRAIDVDPSEAKGVFRLLDLDDSGAIDAEEFLNGCLRLRGPASALDLALLMHEVRRLEKQLLHSHAGKILNEGNLSKDRDADAEASEELRRSAVPPAGGDVADVPFAPEENLMNLTEEEVLVAALRGPNRPQLD